jgi:hypothetical protein
MTGFKSKRQAAQAKLDDDDAQVYIAEYEAALLVSYQSGFADGKRAAQPEQQAEPCIGKDPRCPCQDGDACHYKDCGNTKARPVPPAQPEQGPVAWAVQGCSKMWRDEFAEIDAKAEAKRIGGTCVAYALYTTPPAAQRKPLTATTIGNMMPSTIPTEYDGALMEFARAIEAKLKERNGY